MGYPRIDGRRVLVAPLKARVSKCHFSEIEIDPETYKVKINGEVATVEPASKLSLARLYSLY